MDQFRVDPEHYPRLYAPKPLQVAFRKISPHSRAWQQGVENREMDDARLGRQSTETFVVMNRFCPVNIQAIGLYSLRDNVCYQVPPIPHAKSEIPWYCQCIALEGKLYVFGGSNSKLRSTPFRIPSRDELHVLDLAVGQEWKQCASMQQPRHRFGCAVLKGKIYVCGGTSSDQLPVRGTEVYDPNVDAWTTVSPMTSLRLGHEVHTVGEELVVYGGRFYDSDFQEKMQELHETMTERRINDWEREYTHIAARLEVYNPGQDIWTVPPENSAWKLADEFSETLFTAEGKLHSIALVGISFQIYVFDTEQKTKTPLHTCFFDIGVEFHLPSMKIEAVLEDGDELFALFCCVRVGRRRLKDIDVRGILRSRPGSGLASNRFVWELAQWEPFAQGRLPFPSFMRSLRL